ncbi:hypothetical protein EsDP_00004988 [Epichloe bromicola]|uniref:Uncharacterized protein n=1 Tax=Epichloe bromicola TaxID=79588 RepID=A0ABQ0CTC6_9HYPO
MAEIQMEVDTAPQFGIEAHLDDDLIDYDTEVEKEPDHVDDPKSIDSKRLPMDENTNVEQQHDEDVNDLEGVDQEEAMYAQIDHESLKETNQALEPPHEIDYDIEDSSNLHAAGDASEIESQAAGEHETDDDPYKKETRDQGEIGGRAEDHEISWEHEHEQTLEPIIEESDMSAADAHGDKTLPTVSAASETMDQEYIEQQHEAQTDIAKESRFAEVHDEGVDDSGPNLDESLEAEATHQEESDTDSPQFPAITVQYKGDEFPCFSAKSDGFFSQLSILDENIKSLLDGFREELANELLAEDELVFQVDELGLEFSESSSPDLLANITFRQVIEIFDILVKNQDPDNTRPLYTYLFTRPSTSKRFDFLMESATEGKGLDEVIHLFQSPTPYTHGADTGDVSVVEDLEAHFDEDESADDEDTTESGQAPQNLEPTSQVNELDIDKHEIPDQQEFVAENDPEGAAESHHLEEDIMVSGALAAEDDVGDGEEVDEEAVFADPHLAIPVNDTNDNAAAAEESDGIAAVAPSADEPERTEAHDVLGTDFDEPVEVTSINGAIEEEVGQEDTQNEYPHVGVNDTSTMNTTSGSEGQIPYVPAEFDTIDGGADGLVFKDEADEEEVDGEIDWRDDDPETLHDGVSEDTSPNTAKRARGDDENGAEDDQSQSYLSS